MQGVRIASWGPLEFQNFAIGAELLMPALDHHFELVAKVRADLPFRTRRV